MVFRSRCIGSEAGDHKKCRRSSERCLWHVYRCGWDQGATTVCTTSTLFFPIMCVQHAYVILSYV